MERNLRKERIGVVVSNKMDKSITVAIKRKEKHPIYGKFVNKTKKFVAHDDANSCTVHSVVYNLTDRTAFWVPNEHYDDKAAWFTFQLPAES